MFLIIQRAIEKNKQIEINNYNDLKKIVDELFTTEEKQNIKLDEYFYFCSNSTFGNSIDDICKIKKNDNYQTLLESLAKDTKLYRMYYKRKIMILILQRAIETNKQIEINNYEDTKKTINELFTPEEKKAIDKYTILCSYLSTGKCKAKANCHYGNNNVCKLNKTDDYKTLLTSLYKKNIEDSKKLEELKIFKKN
jgi:hypothetical protein